MRTRTKWIAAGTSAVGMVAIMSAGVGATTAPPPVASIQLSAAGGQAGTVAADKAAVAYVNAHYPGQGVANVLVTSPDVEHGVPVYDIRVVAPSGATYVVHVQQSNGAVLSASLAELQVTTPPATTPPATTPPVTTPPVTTPPATTPPATTPPATTPPATTPPVTTPIKVPEPVQVTEPTQAPEPVQVTEPTQAPEPTQQSSDSGSSTDTRSGASTTGSSGSGSSTDSGSSGTKKSDG